MKKDIYKQIFQTRTFYIVFSIIASIALWTYVEYAENPDVSVTVSGIAVDVTGEDTLADSNLVVTGMDNSVLSVRFTGKRNTVVSFNNRNITATLDLSEIARSGVAGVYQLRYEINYPDGTNQNAVTAMNTATSFITVTVERLITKTVKVEGSNEGSVAPGYQAEPLTFDADTITVSGPESVVETVDHAWVVLNRKDVSQTLTEQVDVTLVDADGIPISMDNLTLSQNVIAVTLTIKMVKEVTLDVNLVSGASADDKNTVIKIEPATITLSGDPAVLTDLNKLILGTVNLTDFTSTFNEVMKIQLPNGVENLSGETTASVSVEVIGCASKRLSATNISTRNVTDGYKDVIITQSLDITLRGAQSDLDQITADNIRIIADLSELGNTTGTFSVAAIINVDGFPNVDAIGPYTVTVAVTEATG